MILKEILNAGHEKAAFWRGFGTRHTKMEESCCTFHPDKKDQQI